MWELIWFVVLTVAAELLRPKPKDVPPASLGDFTFPTAEDGRAIPIPVGTVLVSGSNIVWYGDLRKKKITQRTGLFGGSTTVGEQFYIGFQAAICLGPVDALVGMRWDDKEITYSSATVGDKLQLTFNQEEFFGGRRSEGGISGVMDFYYGTATQLPNDYLETAVGEDMPGYRSVCYAVARQMYIGTTKYFKAPAWIVRRCPNTLGLTGDRHIIDGRAANPAAVIYWLLTDRDIGLQTPATQINASTFIDAGNTLAAEGLGVNFLYDQFSIAGDLIEDILRHVDGFRYIDPETGLYCMGLVRDDYAVDTLLRVDETNIVGTTGVEVDEPSWADLVNNVVVEYTDTNFRKASIPYMNLAGVERRGEVETRTLQYLGFHRDDMALALAARLSKRYAYPLKSGVFRLNRTAWRLHEGALFLWTGYPYDQGSRVMRCIEVNYGTLEDGEMQVSAIEDVFSIDQIAYLPPSSDWVDPAGLPDPVAAQAVIEAPSHLIDGSTERFLLLLAARSSELDSGFLVMTDYGAVGTYAETADAPVFAASGLLVGAYDPTRGIDATGFTVDGGVDLEDLESITEAEFLRGLNVCMIGSELFAWRDVTDNGNGSYTFSRVIRGIFDSVPRPHADNSRVWFLRGVQLADDDPIGSDQSVNLRLLPYNGRGIVDLVDAATLSITTTSRAVRPYPPGYFRINGSYDPGVLAGVDAAITWAARNRSAQYAADTIVRQDAASGWTAEGSFQLQFWILGVLRRTETVAGLAFTYTTTMRTADYGADTTAPVEIRGYGLNAAGTVQSWDYQSVEIEMVYSA